MLYIHLHAGLLCSSYLLLYGISALDFNHEFISDDVNTGTTTWTRTLTGGYIFYVHREKPNL